MSKPSAVPPAVLLAVLTAVPGSAIAGVPCGPAFAAAAANDDDAPEEEDVPEVKPWEDEVFYSELLARRRIRTGIGILLGSYGAGVALMGIRLAVLGPDGPDATASFAALVPFGAIGLGGTDMAIGILVPTFTSIMPEGADEDALMYFPGGIFLYAAGVLQVVGLVVAIVGGAQIAKLKDKPRMKPWKPPPVLLVPEVCDGRMALRLVARW